MIPGDALPISPLLVGPGLGLIGLSFCPGRIESGQAPRDMAADVGTLRDWPAVAVATLVETPELDLLQVPGLGMALRDAGIAWLHLPIVDMAAPDGNFEAAWVEAGPRLHGWLDAGRNIHLHCRGGRGRAGTIAARLLIERGWEWGRAVSHVRSARPGAIETRQQEAHLAAIARGRGLGGIGRVSGP
jgi:ADP-ribosyl-[dinitrogen reductase] hydrolase